MEEEKIYLKKKKQKKKWDFHRLMKQLFHREEAISNDESYRQMLRLV